MRKVQSKGRQVGGTHYEKYKIQPIDFISLNDIGFVEGNVIKYVVRYKDKNGLEDLQKAKQCLDYLILNYGRNQEVRKPARKVNRKEAGIRQKATRGNHKD